MGNIAIAVEQLGKRYRIGHAAKRPETLRQAIRSSLGAPFHYLRTKLRPPSEDELIWALKDVSFEVKHGEVLGIIGRNGAGKSTLLKILSRITEPTTGQAKVYGRIGSLLEVGTGFHPELTGRENIYLNGAILGMRRVEIDKVFDEIVDFSGVEKFLNTPVKRYSSGMRVRLGFAVAAHLEPEILIVDEVLAVGDAEFQRKCIGKMDEVGKQGRAVLLVSHNMPIIRMICSHAVLLTDGGLNIQGNVDEVTIKYEEDALRGQSDWSHRFPIVNHYYNFALEAVNAQIISEGVHFHLRLNLLVNSQQRLRQIGFKVDIWTSNGTLVTRLGANLTQNIIKELHGQCACVLETRNIEQFLTSGNYTVSIDIVFPKTEMLISADRIAEFRIPVSDLYGTGVPCENTRNGIVPLPMRLTDVRHFDVGPPG